VQTSPEKETGAQFQGGADSTPEKETGQLLYDFEVIKNE
jgi:hypothetical protein